MLTAAEIKAIATSNPLLAEKMTVDRVAYKLLPPEVKKDIDIFADELIKNNTYLQAAIEQYVDSQINLKKLYNSLDDPDKLNEYRDKCEADAKKQISYKIVKSIKAIISKEYLPVMLRRQGQNNRRTYGNNGDSEAVS